MAAKYEDLKLKLETRETPETHLLLVHIPEGFQQQHIAAKVEFHFGRVRVYGELPVENNVIKRFNEVYNVPETCDINNIRGKFEGRIVTITMRKKVISKVAHDQIPQQTAQEAPKTEQETVKDHQGTVPQPPTGEDQQEQKATDDEEKDQKNEEGQYQHHHHQQQQQQNTADEEEDKKGQEGVSEQGVQSTIENEEKADIETPPAKPEATQESTPEIGPKGVPHKDTSIKDAQREEIEKKSLEQAKQPGKAAVLGESPGTDQKESNKKRKASSAIVPYAPKTTKGNDQEKAIQEPAAKRMMTIFEDKQKLIYMGAAFAVVALGVYVSYKLRSSSRK